MPFSKGKKNRVFVYQEQRKERETRKTKKENQKNIRKVQGQERWPFGPPHLTLKPSKKHNKTKQKRNKEGFGPSEVALRATSSKKLNKNKTTKTKNKNKERKREKHKNTKKELFCYQSKFSLFGGCPKSPFLTTWPRKRAPKNTIKLGFQQGIFGQNSYALRNVLFWTKNPNPQIPVIIFCFGSFLLCQQQKHNNLLKLLFLQFFSKPEEENFQQMNLKQRNLKNPIFAPFL